MRKERFTFLCNEHERKLISVLAERLSRSQGDAMRFLVRIAAEELMLDLQNDDPSNTRMKGVKRD